MKRVRVLDVVVLLVMASAAVRAADVIDERAGTPDSPTGQPEVAGFAEFPGNDEDPRVLYILPWQAPTLPRKVDISLSAEAPDLLQPVDPEALERHRLFRQTLNPDLDSNLPMR